MGETSDFWIVVQIKRNSFRVAETGLLRQGFVVFSPKVERTTRRHNREVVEWRLLFPGYFFVQIDLTHPRWRSILGTQGVSRIISGSGGTPAQVPADFIASLRERCDPSGALLPPRVVVPGDQLTFARGALKNFVATVERIDEQKRVWVLLQILGGDREIQISLDDVRLL